MDVPGGGEKCAEKLVELRKQVADLCPKARALTPFSPLFRSTKIQLLCLDLIYHRNYW